jgi:hypothetical protein
MMEMLFYRPWVFLLMMSLFSWGCSAKPEIIEKKCSECHKTSVVYKQKHTQDEWDRLVYGMEARGLRLSPEEKKEILQVLAERYGKKE